MTPCAPVWLHQCSSPSTFARGQRSNPRTLSFELEREVGPGLKTNKQRFQSHLCQNRNFGLLKLFCNNTTVSIVYLAKQYVLY